MIAGMTPEAALIELLDRVGANDGEPVAVSDHELSEWPVIAVAAMKRQGLLQTARNAKSAVCSGCEEACIMPAHVQKRGNEVAVFVICDKRDDTYQVEITPSHLRQWQCSPAAIVQFIASALAIRATDRRPASADFLEIGMTRGQKHNQMLVLKCSEIPRLVAGNVEQPLADFVRFDDSRFSIDPDWVARLVDSVSATDNRYTPSNAKREARKVDTQAMYKDWQKAYRALLKKRPNMPETWYAQQIAKLPVAKDRNAGTIKKNMHA